METYVVLGHGGEYEDSFTEVIYVGEDKTIVFNLNQEENNEYTHLSIELWSNGKKVAEWWAGNGKEWSPRRNC